MVIKRKDKPQVKRGRPPLQRRVRKVEVMLYEDQIQRGKEQPEGLSGLLRILLDKELLRRKGREEKS